MKCARAVLLLLALACACRTSPVALPEVDLGLPPPARETDYLARALTAWHPDPFAHCGEANFSIAVAAATARLREDDPQAWHLEIRKLVALIGDSHTRVDGLGPFESTALPCLLRHFPDGWWIVGSFKGFEHLVGRRVRRFDGREMDEVVAAVRPYASFDNEASLLSGLPGYLCRPEFLNAIGVTASAQQIELELEDLHGVRSTESVPAVAGEQVFTVFFLEPESSAPWLTRHLELSYWYEFIADDVLYIRYRTCAEDPARPMSDFADEIADGLRQRSPRMAILDLRDNGGGNSAVLRPLERVLERAGVRARTRLWVVTNSGTYSSGLLNAWRLRRDAGARIAGEPSAQRPNSFGEVRGFALPVSGIKIGCSTKAFRLVPGDPEVLAVDLPVATLAEDWFRCRDPVLARLLAD